jgi:hypothetical protein
MVAFEILVNGKRICIARLNDGLLRAGVDCMIGGEEEYRLWMHVGGATEKYEPRQWEVPLIRIGDEVAIRIIEVEESGHGPLTQ